MDKVLIRDAKVWEIDQVASLGLASYQEYAEQMSPDAWKIYSENIVDVRSRMTDSEIVVAESGGKLVGSVTFYPIDIERTSILWPSNWAGIRLVAVLPESRGSGIGRMLVRECVLRARIQDAEAVALHTTPLMQVAAAMYQSMGFVRASEYDFQPRANFTVTAYKLVLP